MTMKDDKGEIDMEQQQAVTRKNDEKTVQALLRRVQAFVENQFVLCDEFHEPVSDEDLCELNDVISQIIDLRWKKDKIVTVPVEVTLVNRHRCHRLHFVAEPYSHNEPTAAATLDVIDEAMHIAIMNLGIASDSVQRLNSEREKMMEALALTLFCDVRL